jgi:hypothetical protein
VLPRDALAGLARLAYHADESAFAPDAPSGRRARADLRLVRRSVRAALPWRRRLRIRLHLTRRPTRPAAKWDVRGKEGHPVG